MIWGLHHAVNDMHMPRCSLMPLYLMLLGIPMDWNVILA